MTTSHTTWYNYGQVPDVLCPTPITRPAADGPVDYPERIRLQQGQYIYAVAQLAHPPASQPCTSAVRVRVCDTSGRRSRADARIQTDRGVLCAGGRGEGVVHTGGTSRSPANGVGDATVHGDPIAGALWREMALLRGPEVRTPGGAGDELPAPLTVSDSPGCGAVVDRGRRHRRAPGCERRLTTNDEQGCHYTPLANASLTVPLPKLACGLRRPLR